MIGLFIRLIIHNAIINTIQKTTIKAITLNFKKNDIYISPPTFLLCSKFDEYAKRPQEMRSTTKVEREI